MLACLVFLLPLTIDVVDVCSGQRHEPSTRIGRKRVDHRDQPPAFTGMKETSFRCRDQSFSGYFADVETGCQVYHNCLSDGRNSSFVCANGTIFNQRNFVCDWWYGFDCTEAPGLYHLNILRNSTELRRKANPSSTLARATTRNTSSRRARPQYLPGDTSIYPETSHVPPVPPRTKPTPSRHQGLPQSSRKLVLIPRLVPAEKLQDVLDTPGRFFQLKNKTAGIDGTKLLNQTKHLRGAQGQDAVMTPETLTLDVGNDSKDTSVFKSTTNKTLEELLNSTKHSKVTDHPVLRVLSPAELQREHSTQTGSFFPVKKSLVSEKMAKIWRQMSPQLLSVDLKDISPKGDLSVANSSAGRDVPQDHVPQASLVSVHLHKIQLDSKADRVMDVIAKHKAKLSGYCLCPCV